MEPCGAHEANLLSELDEETWQYLMNELRTAYISDKELDTMITHCWLPHITQEEPHCEKMTDVCQYSAFPLMIWKVKDCSIISSLMLVNTKSSYSFIKIQVTAPHTLTYYL